MKKINFDQDWEFTELSGFAALFNPHAWQPITLPHDAMILKSRRAENTTGKGGGYFPGGVANYRKKFFVPQEWKDEIIQVEFEGVYMNAGVSINGQRICQQPYGYSSFIVDLTPHLVYGEENLLTVVANNTAQPNCRWYSGTGIYRHVWLRRGGNLCIKPWGVFVSTPVVENEVSVVQAQVELIGGCLPDDLTLRSTIVDPQGNTAALIESAARLLTNSHTALLRHAKLWSPDEPHLYTLVSEVLLNGAVIDREETCFGIRSISADAQHGLRLNGKSIKMKGGCIHHDHGPLGAASHDRAEERKVELLKSAGYNALRCAHNPPAPALLDACDRLGMLVIDETFDAWFSAKVTNDYHLYFDDWWQKDTAAMVLRDRNHPSVIFWSIGNEIFEALGNPQGAVWARRQADYVRSLDSTRLITSGVMFNFIEDIASGESGASFKMKPVPSDPQLDTWGRQTEAFIKPLDVAGYNYMAQRYAVDQERFPSRVIIGAETWGHRMFYFWKETERLPNVIGDFVWTAIDYIGEAGGGEVSFDGKASMAGAPFPYHLSGIGDFNICGFKRPQSYYRELLWGVRTAPFIAVHHPQHFGKPLGFTPWAWEPVLDNWTFKGQEGKPVRVDVYAIDAEVELLVNGISAGKKPAGDSCQNKASFDVIYQPGVLEAVGYQGGVETSRTRLETCGDPAGLHLSADRPAIGQEGDLAFITIEVRDAAGRRVMTGELEVTLEITGAGELIALGSGNPRSEEPYSGSRHKTFEGRLLAAVRSRFQPGEISLIARMEGLPASEVSMRVV